MSKIDVFVARKAQLVAARDGMIRQVTALNGAIAEAEYNIKNFDRLVAEQEVKEVAEAELAKKNPPSEQEKPRGRQKD